MALALESPAFAANGEIPRTFTGNGDNVAPPLAWRGVPEAAKSLLLIVEDPDAPAGTVTHWAAYNLDPDLGGLPQGVGEDAFDQGVNDLGHARYDGPKPPKGHGPHRYHFRLSALDVADLGLDDKPTHQMVKKAAREHVIAETVLIGTFETK